MATSLATGLSSRKDSVSAAEEALQKAKKKLGGGRINLTIVYCSSEYDHKKVVEVIRKAFDNAPLIGASTAGEFTEEKVEKGSVAVGLLSSDDIKVFTSMSIGVKQDIETAVKKAAAQLPDNVEGFPFLTGILLIDGLSGIGEEAVLLASCLLGNNTKIIGGMAGDDFKMQETFVFCDDEVSTNALGICLLASKMPLFTGIKHGNIPLSRALKATKTKGNILYEINNKPAWQIWKKETAEAAGEIGIDVEQLEPSVEISKFFTNFMLGLATKKEGEYKIRWPMSINKDGSLNFTCGIVEDSIFRIMQGSDLEKQISASKESAISAMQSAENTGYPEFSGALVFECAVRKLMMGDRFFENVDGFKKALPGIPILGWETYGEIRLEPGQFSGFHNTTAVILLLPKNDKPIWKKKE